MYILDTDVIILFFSNEPEIVRIFNTIENKKGVSVISIAEIVEGLQTDKRKNRRDIFFTFLKKIEILPVTQKTSLVFAAIRYKLRKKGTLVDNMDLLIAATCLEHNATLVTRNVKHFSKIPDLKIYGYKN